MPYNSSGSHSECVKPGMQTDSQYLSAQTERSQRLGSPWFISLPSGLCSASVGEGTGMKSEGRREKPLLLFPILCFLLPLPQGMCLPPVHLLWEKHFFLCSQLSLGSPGCCALPVVLSFQPQTGDSSHLLLTTWVASLTLTWSLSCPSSMVTSCLCSISPLT